VRTSLLVRAALVLLCAAGIVASLISYRSQKRMDEGLERVLAGTLDSRTHDLLESSEALNPDVRRDLLLAQIAQREGRDWEPLMRDALEAEPENVSVFRTYAFLLEQDGRAEEAGRLQERARELDPHAD
jgi:hypothetical protein